MDVPLGIKVFCFSRYKAETFRIDLWKRILWNLKKIQLNQTTHRKNENNNCLNKLNELKFCEVSWNSISNKYWKFDVCQSAIILASWDFIHFLSYVCYITDLTKSMSIGLYITWIFGLEMYVVEVCTTVLILNTL